MSFMSVQDKKKKKTDCQINIPVSSNDATVASGFYSHPEDLPSAWRHDCCQLPKSCSGEVRVVAEMQQKHCSWRTALWNWIIIIMYFKKKLFQKCQLWR